ncbi:hypothetical protein PINS_up020700 [Pythium insidiosum]|nr:hypothetical protein PINS_up020700 [Pythium insidiosum]
MLMLPISIFKLSFKFGDVKTLIVRAGFPAADTSRTDWNWLLEPAQDDAGDEWGDISMYVYQFRRNGCTVDLPSSSCACVTANAPLRHHLAMLRALRRDVLWCGG